MQKPAKIKEKKKVEMLGSSHTSILETGGAENHSECRNQTKELGKPQHLHSKHQNTFTLIPTVARAQL